MPAVSSLVALLFSVLVLIAGNGLLNTLVPLRSKLDGFPPLAIGLIGSAYFVGMLAGSFTTPAIIRRAGPVQAFAAFASVGVVATLAFPVLQDWMAWVGLRAVVGFAFAGFYAVIESWLNARSTNANRGRVYALYQIMTFVGSAGGQQILAASEPRAASLFSVAAGLLVLAVAPLALTKTAPPSAPRVVRLQLGWLVRLSPIAAVASLCIGAANGSFFALAPVYGLGLNLPPASVAAFMTAVTIGTALAVYPVARLSDGYDRRLVLFVFAAIGVLVEAMLALGGGTASPLLLGCLGVAVGASTMVLYTVAISHANDSSGPENGVAVSAGMLFLYCAGAIVMPAIGSILMAWFGPSALFVQNAIVHGILAGYVLWHLLAPRAMRAPQGQRRLTAPRLG